ncbi:MAG TPA: hypothetical protein DG048_18820 [Pseudoalteromonas sp.]|nr:hypothetical protein [Pseudoalteromonas sp.]
MQFPYTALSPTLGTQIEYDESELWNEVNRILDEDTESQFSVGQQLYFNLIHGCVNPAYFLDDEVVLNLEEYAIMKRFSIPPTQSIENAVYERLVTFSAIDDEVTAINKLKNKDG